MGTLTNSRATTVEKEQDSNKVATYNALAQILDSLEAGKLDVSITSADVTLTGTPAAPQAQNKYFNLSGTLTGNRSLVFPVNDATTGNPRLIAVKNGTSGAFTVTVKVSGQTGVTVTQGYTAILLHNGTDFIKFNEVPSAGEAWISWTPTFTNLTVGNGTLTAKYSRSGNRIIARLGFVFGSTSSMGTTPSFTLPVASVSYPGTSSAQVLGDAQHYDTSASQNYGGNIIWKSTVDAYLGVFDASATYLKTVTPTSTIPFTWATGDEIHATFIYEAA